jgi:spoIIIJ-associated protein
LIEESVSETEPTVAEPAEDAEATPGAEAAGDEASAAGSGPRSGVAALEQEGEIAADYLEVLLDILDLDGDLDLDVENDRAVVEIVGDNLDHLVGSKGETLDALQELTRLAVLQASGQRSRLMLDVGGFRAGRRQELVALAREVAERVTSGGEPERLSPMNPFERKVVHDALAEIGGLVSESEGEEPQRRIVVRPA